MAKSMAKGKAAKEEDAPVTGRKMSRKASRKQSKAQIKEEEQEAEAEKDAAPAETEEKDEGSRKQSLANGADDGKKRKGSKFSIGGKKK